MKKKTNKSKKPVAPKPAAVKLNWDGEKWNADPINEKELKDFLESIKNNTKTQVDPPGHSTTPDNLYIEGTRIVVAVAKTLSYSKNGVPATYKMEPGRQIAQACHAVSALKLRYCEEQYSPGAHDLRKMVIQVMENPITTIVLQARDTKEIIHIAEMCEEKGLLHFCFSDDNEAVYGTTDRIPSAVAIGPIHANRLVGITDYLPLWKDGVTDVS